MTQDKQHFPQDAPETNSSLAALNNTGGNRQGISIDFGILTYSTNDRKAGASLLLSIALLVFASITVVLHGVGAIPHGDVLSSVLEFVSHAFIFVVATAVGAQKS